MKRSLTFLLAIILCLSCMLLQGCSDNNNVLDILKKPLKVSDLSIEDFEWETIPSKYHGYDCYSFSLINNSDYDIIGVEFTYKVRDDVSENELTVYEEFMKEHDGYIEEADSPRGVILRGDKNSLVLKGEKLTGLRFTVGYDRWAWYDYPTKEQFELMEPKEMEIGVVGNDNKFYIAYYDFDNTTWVLDEETLPINVWSEKEIAKKITKPAEDHHIVINDEEDDFAVYSYGISVDEYNSYIEAIENSGFVRDDTYSGHFEGKNEDGYIVELWYYEADERLSISVGKE